MPIAGTGDAGVLQGVLDGEEHTGCRAMVALVDEDRAELVAVTFQGQVDDGVEQRMARADKGPPRAVRAGRPAASRTRSVRSGGGLARWFRSSRSRFRMRAGTCDTW